MVEIADIVWPPEGDAAAWWAAEEWLDDRRFELMEDDELDLGPKCRNSGETVRRCKAIDLCDCFDYDELEEWRSHGVSAVDEKPAELLGVSGVQLRLFTVGQSGS